MTTTLEQPLQRGYTFTLELTPALKKLADRYFSDSEFRVNLHRDTNGTLAEAGILLTDLEMATVTSYVCSPLVTVLNQKLVGKPDEAGSNNVLSPFMANSWGNDR